MVAQIDTLDNAKLTKVKDLESKLGCCVVALDKSAKPPKVARLSQPQLAELQALEKELGKTLVAYS